jgi:hypothetical protein
MRGSFICAPIDVLNEGARLPSDKSCVGALMIGHDQPGHFSKPEHMVWAQQCGTLMGILYELCRERLIDLTAFEDWEDLDDLLNPRSAQQSGQNGSIDFQRVLEDIETCRSILQCKLFAIARGMGISERTLRLVLNERKCSRETLEKIAKFTAEHIKGRTLEYYEPIRRRRRGGAR